MVLNDAKIYFKSGSSDFSTENVLKRVAAYGVPAETVDTVERTYFNTEHVKKYGTGYSDMGEITIRVDLDTDNMAQIQTIKGLMVARTEVTFGYVVDPVLTTLNVQFSGVITSVNDVDGDITPGANAEATITVKPTTRLSAFVEPAGASTYTAVTPVGTENPAEEGWYVLSGDIYVGTTDTEVDENKTYFSKD